MSASVSPFSHTTTLHPEFHDLDPMGIVWHGNYPKYLEIARCALLQQFDYDYPQMRDSGYAWPIVEMHMKYVRSLQYRQRIHICASLVEWENRLKIKYRMTDADTGQRLHDAHTVQVAVDMRTQAMCFVCPPVLFERLGVKP